MNQQAFPGQRFIRRDGYQTKETEPTEGMSLRDYFAAKAMQAISMDPSFALRYDPEQVADRAYEWADAMLKARGA